MAANANNDGQRFKIIANGDGSFRIMPANSTTRVLDVEGATTADNATIQIWPWNSGNQMRWIFENATGMYDLHAMIDADGADRAWWINNSYNSVYNYMNHSGVSYGAMNYNSTTALQNLQNRNMYIIHTHGSADSIKYTASNGTVTYMTRTNIDALPVNALKNQQLVIYATCSAGQGGINAQNMVNSTFNKGAKTVIGWTDTTYVSQMNRWLYEFLLAAGERKKTIGESCSDADYYVGIYYLLSGHGGTDEEDRLVRGSTIQKLAN